MIIKCFDQCFDCGSDKELRIALCEGKKDFICQKCFDRNMDKLSDNLNKVLKSEKVVNIINNELNK